MNRNYTRIEYYFFIPFNYVRYLSFVDIYHFIFAISLQILAPLQFVWCIFEFWKRNNKYCYTTLISTILIIQHYSWTRIKIKYQITKWKIRNNHFNNFCNTDLQDPSLGGMYEIYFLYYINYINIFYYFIFYHLFSLCKYISYLSLDKFILVYTNWVFLFL